ncbi:MAG TPA: ATP-dependent acyl-CoA ligase [Xanthobacteraceae bacterium]|nr:ATP-dependent acyl-CoA ligase [Xanthobacteraceae bacterium]
MIDTAASRAQLVQSFAPAQRTLPAMLMRQAERHGDKPLASAGEASWSYAQTAAAAARTAGTLRAAGIAAGDRVAIIAANRIELLGLLLGCGWLGAVAVPINVASRGPQLQHILANCGARLLVMEPEHAENLAMLDADALALEAIWTLGAPGELRFGRIAARAMPAQGAAIPPAPLKPSDLAMILYTSGTTGPSKGVCCPHAQYFWWGVNTAALLGITSDDVLCTSLPLFHTNAINTFYQALLTGAAVRYEKRFSASGFFSALAQHGATVTYLLGAMVPILLARPESAEERAHATRLALAPGVPAQFHAPFTRRTGIRLIDGWGSTETNVVLGTTVERQRPGLMGPAAEGFAARVVDDADNELPDGVAGELIVRAEEPFAFATGYFGAAETTVEAWRNLWFHTGDRVMREADGYFRFVDRLKDAMRRRGENISSFEVEQVLLGHPAIANAAVFPVRSLLAEDEVMAALVLRPGPALAPADVIAYCAPRLPYFAVPRYLEFMPELPMTENGKVQKYKLRERGITAHTWDGGAGRSTAQSRKTSS